MSHTIGKGKVHVLDPITGDVKCTLDCADFKISVADPILPKVYSDEATLTFNWDSKLIDELEHRKCMTQEEFQQMYMGTFDMEDKDENK